MVLCGVASSLITGSGMRAHRHRALITFRQPLYCAVVDRRHRVCQHGRKERMPLAMVFRVILRTGCGQCTSCFPSDDTQGGYCRIDMRERDSIP